MTTISHVSVSLNDRVSRRSTLGRLTRHYSWILAALALGACSRDAAPPDDLTKPMASASASAGPVEVRHVADDPALRQRLSPAALLSYFPTALGPREPIVRSKSLRDPAGELGASWVRVLYRDYDDKFSAVIQVEVADLVDQPDSQDRAMVESGRYIDKGTGEVSARRTIAGGMGRDFALKGGGFPKVYILLADRFFVTLSAESRDMQPDALWDLYEASGLSRIAGAPVDGEAGVPNEPAWATKVVAEWKQTAAETPAPPKSVAVIVVPLPGCDDILPVAEVERVCGVSGVRVYPSAFADEGVATCNRKYAIPGNLSGLQFIVSRYGNASVARSGQRVASETRNPSDLREVAGLGEAATRYVREPLGHTTARVLNVAAGTDLIEMKSLLMSEEADAEVCTLDQLEVLARGVMGRLRN